MSKKITIVGQGYVGLSLSVLLSQINSVTALDVDEKKVNLINKYQSPIKDKEIEDYLASKKLNLKATTNKNEAYKDASLVIIAVPTDYDISTGSFNTKIVEDIIKDILLLNTSATIVIKSTVPIGFTDMIKSKFSISNIFFSPEFLRETKALYDNLYPSRIVVGEINDKATEFANLLLEASLNDKGEIKVFKMSSKEAEAVKLFSNTFLAMRVSFFNELDSFSEVNNINAENVINGICADPRIGNFYNNPSFGYGGYCLPKDTQQLLENFKDTPNEIIKSVIKANATRKQFIVNSVLKRNPKNIGIFRLTMKEESDNFRDSAVLDIIKILQKKNISIEVYEPMINKINYDVKLNNDLESFLSNADIIIANRNSHLLDDVKERVYSRDIFNNN
tara:strand:+ start:1426 stop:2601 length:1176 start_codon:yes stop_codon:yes gene_type:complete